MKNIRCISNWWNIKRTFWEFPNRLLYNLPNIRYIVCNQKTAYGYSREGKVAIYGYEALYTVNAVMVMPPLKKDSSRENNHYQGKGKKQSEKGAFDSLLNSEQEKVKQSDIGYSQVGYTRDAKAFRMNYQTHAYV